MTGHSEAIDQLAAALDEDGVHGAGREQWIRVFAHRVEMSDSGCVLWKAACTRLGYGQVGCKFSRSMNAIRTHRLSFAIARHGAAIPKGMAVLHRCDVRNCVRPSHLFAGTQADNVADMVAKGRNRVVPLLGVDNPAARIDDDTVRAIRKAIRDGGRSQARIATDFGISAMTVSRIKNSHLWSHVS